MYSIHKPRGTMRRPNGATVEEHTVLIRVLVIGPTWDKSLLLQDTASAIATVDRQCLAWSAVADTSDHTYVLMYRGNSSAHGMARDWVDATMTAASLSPRLTVLPHGVPTDPPDVSITVLADVVPVVSAWPQCLDELVEYHGGGGANPRDIWVPSLVPSMPTSDDLSSCVFMMPICIEIAGIGRLGYTCLESQGGFGNLGMRRRQGVGVPVPALADCRYRLPDQNSSGFVRSVGWMEAETSAQHLGVDSLSGIVRCLVPSALDALVSGSSDSLGMHIG